MTTKKLRVLLAEGKLGEVAECLRLLFPEPDNTLDLTVVSSISTMLPTIKMVAPDILLFDLSLAHPDVPGAVRFLHRSVPGVPLIVFADDTHKDYAVQSLKDGATDYLLKGFMDPRTLDRALRAALRPNKLQTSPDLPRDPSTGLFLREGFVTIGTRAMEAAPRSHGTLVLVCAWFENLAALRAEFGPGTAEGYIREVGHLLVQNFRRNDVVARLGDAEFAALALDAAEPSLPVLRQRLENRIAVHNEARAPWGPLKLRMNAGFWSSKLNTTFAEFLDSVEAGLHLAPMIPVRAKVLGEHP